MVLNSCLLFEDAVHGAAGPHGRLALLEVEPVVASDVHGLALDALVLLDDFAPVAAELLVEVLVVGVGLGEKFSPVEGDVEVGGAVVDLVDPAGGALPVVEDAADGLVQGGAEQLGLFVVVAGGGG